MFLKFAMPICLLCATASAAFAQDGGRQYAAQCFQCHGTNGISVADIDSLAGKSAKEIVEKLFEMKREAKAGNLMHKIALGYTDPQIRELAAYLATVNRGGND